MDNMSLCHVCSSRYAARRWGAAGAVAAVLLYYHSVRSRAAYNPHIALWLVCTMVYYGEGLCKREKNRRNGAFWLACTMGRQVRPWACGLNDLISVSGRRNWVDVRMGMVIDLISVFGSKLTCFSCMDRNWLGLSVQIEIGFVYCVSD